MEFEKRLERFWYCSSDMWHKCSWRSIRRRRRLMIHLPRWSRLNCWIDHCRIVWEEKIEFLRRRKGRLQCLRMKQGDLHLQSSTNLSFCSLDEKDLLEWSSLRDAILHRSDWSMFSSNWSWRVISLPGTIPLHSSILEEEEETNQSDSMDRHRPDRVSFVDHHGSEWEDVESRRANSSLFKRRTWIEWTNLI